MDKRRHVPHLLRARRGPRRDDRRRHARANGRRRLGAVCARDRDPGARGDAREATAMRSSVSYGFLDAFNPTLRRQRHAARTGRVVPGVGWFDNDYLGIDQGPIIAMIENYAPGWSGADATNPVHRARPEARGLHRRMARPGPGTRSDRRATRCSALLFATMTRRRPARTRPTGGVQPTLRIWAFGARGRGRRRS